MPLNVLLERPTPAADRHANAMQERNRKDFHHEFTTLRFRPLTEHGTWQGTNRYLPDASEVRP